MADSTYGVDSNGLGHDFEKVDSTVDTADAVAVVPPSNFDPNILPSFEENGSLNEKADIPFTSEEAKLLNRVEAIAKPSSSSSKCAVSVECWFKSIDPRVLELVYWRDPKKTGVVFGSLLLLLLSLVLFSVLSIVAYTLLAALAVAMSFCVFKKCMQAVQKTGEGHPFKHLLDVELSISEAKAHRLADQITRRLVDTARFLRDLLFVADLADSLKFGVALWCLTYLGAAFNGMTLLILGLIAAFTIPKFYEVNKTQVDHYIELARTHVKAVIARVQEKLPLPGKKEVKVE